MKKTHVIDCDADPYLPSGWKGVEEHQKKGGSFIFGASQVSLYFSERQKQSPWLKGHKLRQELKGKPVLNANVLDYLLAHPELIPEEWKGQYTFFWGTIYRDSDGSLCVRYLYWDGDRWSWSSSWLDDDFYGDSPAAVRASTSHSEPSSSFDALSLELRVAKIEKWIESVRSQLL